MGVGEWMEPWLVLLQSQMVRTSSSLLFGLVMVLGTGLQDLSSRQGLELRVTSLDP